MLKKPVQISREGLLTSYAARESFQCRKSYQKLGIFFDVILLLLLKYQAIKYYLDLSGHYVYLFVCTLSVQLKKKTSQLGS